MADRTMHTDALLTLGTIIGDTEKRDAIHLAVEPVTAQHPLKPGEHVGLLSNGSASRYAPEKLGIVDPFLKEQVATGERFWLVVYPRKITSLRHVWEHPDFLPMESEKQAVSGEAQDVRRAKASAVIQMQADNHGISFEEMMWGARAAAKSGDYMIDGGRWEGEGIYGEAAEEFWNAYEIITGETVDEDDRTSIFSCSC